MNLTARAALASLLAVCLGSLAACEEQPAPRAATPQPATPSAPHSTAAGHGGPIIELGTATIGGFDVRATRDQGEIIAGKDAPIDVTVVPAPGSTAKPAAVRFWIGTEDGQGSVKARAEIENPAEPNRWHTHAEIPSPLPEGSRLWVEIEDEQGQTSVGSFLLNQ